MLKRVPVLLMNAKDDARSENGDSGHEADRYSDCSTTSMPGFKVVNGSMVDDLQGVRAWQSISVHLHDIVATLLRAFTAFLRTQ